MRQEVQIQPAAYNSGRQAAESIFGFFDLV
jgi:hypothetical protein